MEEVICNATIAVIMVYSACHETQYFVEQDPGAPNLGCAPELGQRRVLFTLVKIRANNFKKYIFKIIKKPITV